METNKNKWYKKGFEDGWDYGFVAAISIGLIFGLFIGYVLF